MLSRSHGPNFVGRISSTAITPAFEVDVDRG
jgi:hypothetical protein